ncbi:MarR family winged helix-turn-helix transcriptional regulator [uncultured Selenomonas sp.]|uniref:MarR family winged helix-turn-helix transcriptional regulator n=1 Tax=uncultured Selenomonas sp. TaxID=159275 RepID=UPI0025DA7F40|nr:MarR family transcriptional regulator [uncultured Selenomonas sp.]
MQAVQETNERHDIRTMSRSFIEMLVLIHRKFYRGITTPVPLNQFAVLMVLRVEEPASPTAIGDILHISKQQMTSITEKLVDAGFLSRAVDPADRRRLLLSLTKRGVDILDHQNDIVKRKFIESLDDLTSEERDDLAHSIEMITHYVEKMRRASDF